jgi:pimeloyl-ACP methyl ester carboxylesterase
MTLVRTVRHMAASEPALQLGAKQAADPSRVYYWGHSLGATMGAAFLGYDPDLTRGVLTAGGGPWSTEAQRNINWEKLGPLVRLAYPDPLDVQLGIALMQADYDFVDATTAAAAGLSSKQVLMEMSVGDAQVSNVATETLARTLGVSLVGQTSLPLFGIQTAGAGAQSGLTIWDLHPSSQPPLTNTALPADNGVHGAVLMLPKLQQQMQLFFSTGAVVDTCGGICSF